MNEFEEFLVGIRADTQAFRRDIEEMRRSLSDGLGGAADIAGRRIEVALLRAVRTGKLGFEDLKRTALSIMSEIASVAVRNGLGAIFGGKGGGIAGIGSQVLGGLLGIPGRAIGGPVAPGRAYAVGENGPELFVPTSSGRIETLGASGRNVNISISINASESREPEALARSSRQIAKAVRGALLNSE